MSYSFSVRGATIAQVMEKVTAELDKVVVAQPIHSADRAQAQSSVEAFLSVLPTNIDNREFYVSVSGSVGWGGKLGSVDQVLTSAGVSVSASLIAKEKS